ncbi:hypothetical protein Tco_0733407, partial [Tanacetum coccineum]
ETEYTEFESDDNEVAVADIAVPYREQHVGPTWLMLHIMISLAFMPKVVQQEMLTAGGSNLPQTIHEVIPLLACRLARWNDR